MSDVWSGVPAPWREAVEAYAKAAVRTAIAGPNVEYARRKIRKAARFKVAEVLRAASREAQELRADKERLDYIEAQSLFGYFKGLGEVIFTAPEKEPPGDTPSFRTMIDQKIQREAARAAGPPPLPSPSEVPVTPLPLVPIPFAERETVYSAYLEKLFDEDRPREDGEQPYDWREKVVLNEAFRLGLLKGDPFVGGGESWYTLHHWRIHPTFEGQPEDWDGLRFWINYVLGMSPDTPEELRPVRYDRQAVQAWRMAQDSDLPFPRGV